VKPGASDPHTQTLDSASQRRFLEYFAQLCNSHDQLPPQVRPARITRIQLMGMAKMSTIGIRCFELEGTRSLRKRLSTAAEGKSKACNESHPEAERNAKEMDEDSTEDKYDDESALDSMLGEPEFSLMERLAGMIEEASMDSQRAGCAPMPGTPVFSTNPLLETEGSIWKLPPDDDGGFTPGVWEVKDAQLAGEFNIEVHRSNPNNGTLSEKASFKSCGWISWLWRCFVCRRRSGGISSKTFNGGMLFACWMHTAFLEADEALPEGLEKNQQAGHSVAVSLERFKLDKAAGAPSLRSHSTALKLHIVFEVDHRIELRALEHEGNAEMNLASNVGISQECSLEWLTWVSEKIWPSFLNGFEKIIKDTLEDAKSSLPSPLKKLKLAQCDFGQNFPKFGPIHASSKTHEGSLEVQLDIWVSYSADTQIVLHGGYVSLGISGFTINGLLSVKFKPILRELPVFAALQLFFLNVPEVSLRFANLLDIANSSMIRTLIHKHIENQVCRVMVLPNIININWRDSKCDRTVSFQNALPCYVFRFAIIEARSLKTTHSIFNHHDPETFVRVKIGNQTAKTRTVSSASRPVWDEEFDFLVYDLRQFIHLTVFEVDFASRKSAIGSLKRTLPSPSTSKLMALSEVVAAAADGIWLKLTDTPDDAQSEIFLSGVLHDLRAEPRRISSFITADARRFTDVDTDIAEEAVQSPAVASCSSLPSLQCAVPAFPDDDAPDISEFVEGHAGAVALLVCEIFGGHLPMSIATPASVRVEVRLGGARTVQVCKEAAKMDPGNVGEKLQKSIERFAELGLTPSQVAGALDEDLVAVEKIMRKCRWNLEVPQKVCVLLHPSHLAENKEIEVSLKLPKGKNLVIGLIPVEALLSVRNARHSKVLVYADEKANKVELDLEVGMYALVRERDPTQPASAENVLGDGNLPRDWATT